jgi:hypothetical protein
MDMRTAVTCLSALAGGLAVITMIAACGDDERPPVAVNVGAPSSSSSSSSSSGAGSIDAGEAPPEADLCATLEQQSQVVAEQVIPGAAPAPTGGLITPGLYVLNELRLFDPTPDEDAGSDPQPPGPTGNYGRITMKVTAESIRFIAARGTDPDALPGDAPRVVTYKAAGTSLELTEACTTNANPTALAYSILDPGQVAFHVGPNRVEVFLKKP